MKPQDLTIEDCRSARRSVTLWCEGRCPGRDLDLSRLERWADRKLLDLMRKGLFVCSRCGQPAAFVSVSAHLIADPILKWKVGDDALPDA
jgi:hypothetical protein